MVHEYGNPVCEDQKAKKTEPRNITADGIAIDYVETDITEDLTDNSKKAIVGVISVQGAGKPGATAAIACVLFKHRNMLTPQGR